MVTHTNLVLLVEPNGAAGTLDQTLGDAGWRVIRAGPVGEAMECAKRDQPSAIVFRGTLDAAVPLVKKMRCNARTALLPVVIVADASDAARQELSRWGVTSVLDAATADRQIADAVRQLAPLPRPAQAPDAELGRPDRLRVLERTNLLSSAVYVSKATTADERIVRDLTTIRNDKCDYFSMVVVAKKTQSGVLAGRVAQLVPQAFQPSAEPAAAEGAP